MNITTLETRRLRGDLIQVFKIFKGLDNVQHSDFFIMADTEPRGHELKVYKPQVHLDIRKYFFSVRIVDARNNNNNNNNNNNTSICKAHNVSIRAESEVPNSLSAALLHHNTVENFKRKLDCLFKDWGYE